MNIDQFGEIRIVETRPNDQEKNDSESENKKFKIKIPVEAIKKKQAKNNLKNGLKVIVLHQDKQFGAEDFPIACIQMKHMSKFFIL